jgi:pyruvate dehydrogenase E2 component (dihydrolipoamide acetyltransferase)
VEELKLPELGENIEQVDVSAVLVSVGDFVRRDQPVIEVETEKASLEVPAISDGRVTELLVKQGDKVQVGQVLLRLEEQVGEVETVAETPREPGQRETETPGIEPPAEPAGSPAAESAAEREAAEVASTHAMQATADPTVAPVISFPRKSRPEIGIVAPAAPSSRALASELGVDINQVSGSGPGGRISRDDVKAHAKRIILDRSAAAGGVAQPAVAPLPDLGQWGEVEHRQLTNIRRATAASMSNAWSTVPHVTQFDRAEITQLESMRRRFNQRSEAVERKLTMTAITIKTVASALKQFPKFNASLDLANDAIVYKKYVHIGVAVDTDRGLLVPVIRDVDRKSLVQVAVELNDVAQRARAKKITPDEMRGACFTVSNLGGLGTTYFSPIVNWPEVAILGVGRAEQQAVFEEGQFRPGLILPLSLSYDHRLIDGADAARFLRWVAEALEQPLLLLLDE